MPQKMVQQVHAVMLEVLVLSMVTVWANQDLPIVELARIKAENPQIAPDYVERVSDSTLQGPVAR